MSTDLTTSAWAHGAGRARRRAVVAASIFGALLAGSATAADPAGAAELGETTACYLVGVHTGYRNWGTDALHSTDRGFRTLNANYSYSLTLRGKLYYKPLNGLRYYQFEPSRFGIKGEAQANSGANPSGQALGATAQWTLSSSKTNASYGISVPFSFSASWSNSNTVRSITATHWESTASRSYVGIANASSSFTGAAGRGPGLKNISVRAGAIPGGDSFPFWTASKSWNVASQYAARPEQGPNFQGLSRTNCNSVSW